MTEPERLSMVSDSELERLLLRAGRAPAPADARHRAMVAAMAAMGTVGLAAGSAAASGLAAKTGSALSLKWPAVLGLAGLGAMTAAVAIQTRHPASEVQRVAEAPVTVLAENRHPVATHRAALIAAPSPSATIAPETTASVVASTAPPSRRIPAVEPDPSRAVEPSVHEELGMLEQARSALAAGDAARTLAILDGYAVTFPHPTMAPEATVLRIEALVRAGDMPAAHRVGGAFLAGQPQSPYAERVRSLLGGSNP